MIPPKENGSFVAHMEMVLDVYKRVLDPRYPVVSMDESPKQLIAETGRWGQSTRSCIMTFSTLMRGTSLNISISHVAVAGPSCPSGTYSIQI